MDITLEMEELLLKELLRLFDKKILPFFSFFVIISGIMTFAIIETGAKQYKVQVGDRIQIERLTDKEFKEGDTIIFDSVVLTDDGSKTEVGTPTLSGKKVEAKFIEEVKGDKIRIQKFKSKSNYSKVTGHRQKLFVVEITKI
jgi:large subunit ribosomal protein L21